MSAPPSSRPLRLVLGYVFVLGSFALLSRAVAYPDWTNCPAMCQCRWISGKKSALCPNASLSALPSALSPEMQVLDLSGNRIAELGADVFKRANLLNLQKLYMRRSGIFVIHQEAFSNMSILVEVDLSDNNLTRLERDTFVGNDRLKVLILSGNPFGELREYRFPRLVHMRRLQLDRCLLRSVHEDVFRQLEFLETLHLNDNLLEYLDGAITENLRQLKTLYLSNNRWRCNCQLKDFRSWIVAHGPRLYRESQICHSPEKVRGRVWEDVKISEFACKPEVFVSTRSFQAEIDGNLSLACFATGDPEPEVWWHFNGSVVNATRTESTNAFFSYSTSVEDRKVGGLVERWSNITIYNTTDADAGDYTCYASNSAGRAEKSATVVIPRVFTAPSLSQTDDWLLWLGLAGGGAMILCASVTSVVLAFCLCGGTCRQRKKREKVKFQGSSSFGDQENTEKTFLVTGTSNEPLSHPGSLGENCTPGDLELVERGSVCDTVNAASVTVERLRQQAEICGSSGLCSPLPCTAIFPPPPPSGFGASLLPATTYGNIFISVSLPQDPEHCYPDLLDIPGHPADKSRTSTATIRAALPPVQVSSFATLPRRALRPLADLGSPYDNMGPRITATGSSTFSLSDPDLPLSPVAQQRLLQPPPEFVSL